jgi:hypothetical protein
MLRDIAIGLIATLAAVVLFIWTRVLLLIHRDGKSLAYANPEKPLWRSCDYCEGCGVVMGDGNPIPREDRSFYRTVSNTAKSYGVIQGPIANTQRCEYCQGLGSTWHYKNAARTIDLPGPGFGGKWN